MEIRINKLLRELNIGFETLEKMLKILGYDEQNLSLISKLPEDIAILVRELCLDDGNYKDLIEIAAKKGVYGNQNESTPTINNVGRIELNEHNNQNGYNSKQRFKEESKFRIY